MSEIVLSLKRGRPTKYTKETARRVLNYIKRCQQNDLFPTIEHLASDLGVGTRTLYAWEKEYSDFQHTLDMLRDVQKHLLITNGLNDKYNSRFASFLLKASHGMSDSKPIFEANQNNFFNVSPEILADAIEITRARKKEIASNLNLTAD